MFDLDTLSHFHFLRPWWLLGLIPLVLSIIYVKQAKESAANWNRVIAPHLLKALTVNGGHGRWFNPVNVSFLAILLCVLSVAGPSWERKASPFVEDEAVLVIALDLSSSMTQTDVQPSREERARQKIEDLLVLRGEAKTGLIVYSGSAHQVIPLTNDPDIVHQFLSALDPAMMPVEGKAPEKALPLADRMLSETFVIEAVSSERSSSERNSSEIKSLKKTVPGTLLLMGDGIGPNTVSTFNAYFKDVEHQLIIMGIGQEKAIASVDANNGAEYRLQVDDLKRLAASAGGSYQALTIDKADVQRVNRSINNHLANVEDSNRPWVDAGYYLLFPFALIFLVWFRKGWTMNWCLLLLWIGTVQFSPVVDATPVALEAVSSEQEGDGQARPAENVGWHWFMGLWLTADQQGRYYFEKGDYATAAQRFSDPEWKALAFYYAENFVAAAEWFAQLDTVEGRFNLANAQAQGQFYLNAVKNYDKVLEREPDHAGALKNRAIVQAIIDDINLMSENQQPEEGESIRELGDEPKRADGAEKQEGLKTEAKQLSAEQILTDERIHDLWMRQVQQDPSRFLRVKFQMQLNQEAQGD